MSLSIKTATLGIASTNTYLIADDETKRAILIDPVDDAEFLHGMALEEGWTIDVIIATHAHFDHVLASEALKSLTGAEFIAHRDAVPWLEQLAQIGLTRFGQAFPNAAVPDRLIGNEPESIALDSIHLTTLYTPGHADGHISLWMPEHRVVFSGDALFSGSIGRTDLPGGDFPTLIDSITSQLLPLGDDVRVFSGHGEPTTIGKERLTNPFLTV
jgi:hydroxyacylglutathione hydrolase